MTNLDPKARPLRMATAWQRLLAMGVLGLFAYLIWAAIHGKYDPEVDSFAGWLQARYQSLVEWIARLWSELFGGAL